jgi:hypothetical protein
MLSTLYRSCVRTTTVQFPSPILKMLPSPSNVKINNAYPKNEGVTPTPYAVSEVLVSDTFSADFSVITGSTTPPCSILNLPTLS